MAEGDGQMLAPTLQAEQVSTTQGKHRRGWVRISAHLALQIRARRDCQHSAASHGTPHSASVRVVTAHHHRASLRAVADTHCCYGVWL